ncbi:hypothetical protein MJH12_05870 [bacterium]|nr:hypothetical protein [bacterium]
MEKYKLEIYRIRQIGSLPSLIRISPYLVLQSKSYYNHVLIKYKDHYYELDCGYSGVHKFHESEFPNSWEKDFSFSFQSDIHPEIPKIKYSQWANIHWFLWNIPLFGRFFKKYINPKFDTNCCGYIAHLLQNKEYFYLHPHQFQKKL